MITKALRGMLLSSAALTAALAVGCSSAPPKYVTTERLDIKEQQTKTGIQIVAETVKEQAESNVIEQSTNVKSVSKITAADPKDKVTIGAPALNPEGTTLIFPIVRPIDQGGFVSNIRSVGREGGAVTNVTSGNYQDYDCKFSKDGTHIYFVSNRGDVKPKIWRIRANGAGGLTKVTSASTIDRMPSPSPDGERIAFQSLMDGDDRWQIWTCSVNGTLPTQMTIGRYPTFSADGKKILYLKTNENTKKTDIWYMDADGSNRTQLTTGESDNDFPSWTPDGRYILYASDAGLDEAKRNNYDIYIMRTDGTGKTQLTTNGSVDTAPIMDPTGKYIYFVSNRGGAWNIWRMELTVDLN